MTTGARCRWEAAEKAIVRDLDRIREAGENRPLRRRVTGLEANPQGKLPPEFAPTRHDATGSAIEVVAQGELEGSGRDESLSSPPFLRS